MTKRLILVLTLYIGVCACSTARPETAANTSASPTPAPPTAEITQAAQEYLKTKPVASVRGITLHRQTDDYYVAGADYTGKDGKSDVYQLIVRRYTDSGGKRYWKAKDLSMPLVLALDSNKQVVEEK